MDSRNENLGHLCLIFDSDNWCKSNMGFMHNIVLKETQLFLRVRIIKESKNNL